MSATDYNNNPIVTDSDSDNEDGFDFQLLFVKFLIHWPWFVASVVACVLLAFVYIRYKTPIYSIDGAVLITEENRSKSKAGTIDLQNLGIMSMTNNFDNEVEILQSRSLVKKVVSDLGLYIQISRKRTFGAATPVYKSSPVEVYVSPEVADTLPTGIYMEISCHLDHTYDVETKYYFEKEEIVENIHFDSLPAVVKTKLCDINLSEKPKANELTKDVVLKTHILPITTAAESYMSALSVTPRSKTTTIAQIEFTDTHPVRGVDFINSLIFNYNQDANNDKNQVAQKTADFIEERINIINQELGHAETKMADFKQSAGLTNLTNDAQLALNQNVKYEQERLENATQISIVENLQNYISSPQNHDEVIPSNVGLTDTNLASVINQYNTNLLEYKRLQRTTSESNPAAQQSRDRVEVLRGSVEATIASTLQGLRIKMADLARQGSKYQSRINSAPRQEQEYLSLSRQQEIMATLYTLLLQKREENAITLAATANNGRLIEDPVSSRRPIAPGKNKILLVAFFLGLVLPFLVLYVIDLTKYKIENQSDIEALTNVPLIAELPAIDATGTNSIVVRENHNGIAEEAFRALRTNLSFMVKPTQKVIMFSSTQPGEGKSFVAANTAMSMAILGKKVIVVGMDIRKPGLNKTFGFSRRQRGVTEYLRDPQNASLDDLILKAVEHDNLDVLPGGTIPPNPTELVASDALDKMVNILRERYDVVILDTAPIGMVSDSAIIARVADVCLYVCRADVTPKAGFQFVNKLAADKKFAQLGVVLNGFDIKKRKNNNIYARRYGYGYGYGSSYGYGYGYGMEEKSATGKKS